MTARTPLPAFPEPDDLAGLEQALEREPDNAVLHANLALIQEKRGHAEAAEYHHRAAHRLAPGVAQIRFNLANWLATSPLSGHQLEARALYLALLRETPDHLGAWNNLGNLLFESGYLSAAHTAYTAAVTHHPDDPGVHVNLGNLLLQQNRTGDAREQFETALLLQSGLAEAHRGLASCFAREGNETRSAPHRQSAFAAQPSLNLSFRGRGKPLLLLVLASAREGNIPWRFLIDRTRFQSTILAMEYLDPAASLPAHDLIFNAIGDADLCRNALEQAVRLVKHSPAPVLNRPDRVLFTGRQSHCERLAGIPGLVLPRVLRFPHPQTAASLESRLSRSRFSYPLLLRAPGYHGGQFFLRVDSPSTLGQALPALPGDSLLAMEFVDTRQAGRYRKFRMMVIDGRFHPIHLALSSQWKVHYFSSDMEKSPAYREEEAAFLDDPAGFLGAPAMAVLEQVRERIGLDYFGMDFGFDASGQVVLFEANPTMVLQPLTEGTQWSYRRPPLERALAATRTLFLTRAGGHAQA